MEYIRKQPLKILVSPLDWGLGHASRCVPVIRQLLQYDVEVLLAGKGKSIALLNDEFPHLKVLEFPGFTPIYSKGGNHDITLLSQFPAMISAFKKEQSALQKINIQFDAIISDHRYGVYQKNALNIFISHQLNLPPHILKPAIQWLHERLMKPFHQLWVPDVSGEEALAGMLGTLHKRGNDIENIGWLSRLKTPNNTQRRYRVAAILSGPEPQRSLFEIEVRNLLVRIKGPNLLVRGVLDDQNEPTDGIEVVGWPNGEMLSQIFGESEIILCRSGYSSLMDIMICGKKAVVVPTPGQHEQIYLAKHLSKFPSIRVAGSADEIEKQIIDLEKIASPVPTTNTLLAPVIDRLISELQMKMQIRPSSV